MIFRLRFLLPLLAATALCGCAAHTPEKQENSAETAKSQPPKLIGRIASVPADKRFVLIQSYGPWTLESGAILTTRGPDERSANLRVTGESLGQFAAADLQSGHAEVGDAVYSRHVPKPPEPQQAPEPNLELPQNQTTGPP